jgi:hypothetical protein
VNEIKINVNYEIFEILEQNKNMRREALMLVLTLYIHMSEIHSNDVVEI